MSTATEQLITAVDFVGIHTRDLATAADFYGGTLGLRRSVWIPERNYAEFETGNLTLSLMNAEGMGLKHTALRNPLAFRVDDVAAARATLEGRGVTFCSRDPRHRRLPHGVLRGSGWQLADAASPVRAARDRVLRESASPA